jgi:hypothetical protein
MDRKNPESVRIFDLIKRPCDFKRGLIFIPADTDPISDSAAGWIGKKEDR